MVEPDEAYFWATHQGAELDLLLFKGGRRFGVEIKRMDAPTLTPSMRIALADLHLEHLTVVYPGKQSYELGPQVTVVPIDTAVAAGTDSLLEAASWCQGETSIGRFDPVIDLWLITLSRPPGLELCGRDLGGTIGEH